MPNMHSNISGGYRNQGGDCYNNRFYMGPAKNNGTLIDIYDKCDNNTFYNIDSSGNTSVITFSNRLNLVNCRIAEASEVSVNTTWGNFMNSRCQSQNHDKTPDNHWIFCDYGNINSQTDVRHASTGIAWKLSPNSANRDVTYPLYLIVASLYCNANEPVTVKRWFYRTNVGITGGLKVDGGQIAGIDADIQVNMTANANVWEEVSITFTPTESGVVDVKAIAYGGTTYSVYVDNNKTS